MEKDIECPYKDRDCVDVKDPFKCWSGLDTDAPFPGSCPFMIEKIKPLFIVRVLKMQENHRETYWVVLDQGDRPKDAKPWDDGRITPFRHENKEYVDSEAEKWAEFLGVSVTK